MSNLKIQGNANGAGTTTLQSGNTASSVTFSLPIADGTNGQALITDGSGVLSFSGVGTDASLITSGTLAVARGGTGVTTSTGTTNVVLSNAPTLVNPTVTNYTETAYVANTSTAITVSLTNGTVQIYTLTGNATVTMPAASAGKSFIILLRQDATGGRTVTWSTVNWASATAPTITSTASKQDIFSFFSDGTSWYGCTLGQNYTQ